MGHLSVRVVGGLYAESDIPFPGSVISGVSLHHFPAVLVAQGSFLKLLLPERHKASTEVLTLPAHTIITLRVKLMLVTGSHFFQVLAPFWLLPSFDTFQSPQRDFLLLFRLYSCYLSGCQDVRLEIYSIILEAKLFQNM